MKRAIEKLRRRVFRAHHYLVFERDCEVSGRPALLEGESVFVIDAEKLDEYADVVNAVERLAADAADYFKDIRAGKVVALVIVSQGEVVHYSYVFLRNKSACILGLNKDTALVGNAFTVPAYRGKGCQPRSVALRAAIAAERGFARIAAETSPDNVASQRGLQKGGMRLVGRLDLVVIMNSLVLRWRRPPEFALLGFCLRA